MLLERDAELAVVATALRALAEGTSSAILLSGPVGIGRTALLRRLPGLAADQDVRVLRANAAPMEQDYAFGVVRQLWDSLLRGAPEETGERWAREHAGLAERVFADDGPPRDPRDAGSEVILRDLWSLIGDVGADSPLLILVDDLQWADAPSLRWFAYLTKRLHGLRVLLVCTLRDGDPGSQQPLIQEIADSSHVLRPGPLSLESAKAMILHRFGERGDEEFARAFHETAAGNPLFLLSVLYSMPLNSRPVADECDTVRSLRPAQLRERLATCLQTQPQPIRALAGAIAAFGEQQNPRLVAQLAGLDSVAFGAAMRALHQFGVLAGEQRPRFTHRVVQDAVESSLTVEERERLHDSAAALLYSHGHPSEHVAAQLMAMATSRRPWSLSVLRAAADTALRRGAPDTAARYLRRALLDSSAQGRERARLLVDLATAEGAFDPVACERHISQAVPLLTTARDRAVAVLRVASTFFGATSPSFVGLLRQVAEELGPADSLAGPARDVALRLEARLRFAGHEHSVELLAAVERLRELGEEPPLQSGAERELVSVLLHAASMTCRVSAGRAALLANRILEREPATSASMPETLPFVVSTLIAADSVRDVDSWLSIAQESQRRKRGITDELLHALRALTLTAQGRLPQARRHAERAVHLADADSPEVSAGFTLALAGVALEIRDLALSENILTAASQRQPGNLHVTAMLQILEASADVLRGDAAGALKRFLACGSQLERSGWRNSVLCPWRLWAISLQRRLGDFHAARALAEEEYAQAVAWGAPAMVGRALRLNGMLQSGAERVESFREAVGVLRDSANRLELARALVQLSRATTDESEAAAAIRESRVHAADCGATWLLERAQNGLGAPVARASMLTRAERRVAELAARGLTNQKIADELGVSTRAVEKHLTNSYRKLGVSGRPELKAELADR